MAWLKFACPLVTPFCILIKSVLPFLNINQQKVEIAVRLNQPSEHHSKSGLGQTLCLPFYISESRRKRLLHLVRANHVCFCTIFLLYWKSSTFSLSRKKNCLMRRPLHILLMAQCACCMPNDSCSPLRCKQIRLHRKVQCSKVGVRDEGGYWSERWSFSVHGVLCIEPQSSPKLHIMRSTRTEFSFGRSAFV